MLASSNDWLHWRTGDGSKYWNNKWRNWQETLIFDVHMNLE